MEIIFEADLIRLLYDDSGITELFLNQVGQQGYLEKWRNGRLGLGGLLGEIKIVCTGFISKIKGLVLCRYHREVCMINRFIFFTFSGETEDEVGSQFLAGCLGKIQVQGKDLDLDLAVKHKSITSHSCPA